ncbi:MAG TPA: sigma 54-interacting transcriptional regulator [Polyangiaceae bacterium LLY-WYZ-15_(1-7)]|nr:hypothetical protein [Sandaracinus sp.]MBJ70219.1 hypothetical protein [Sandaracinus sp.]HJL03101.1 sigma 54-interacting transcriptional regulator [Polyangiaceae bacterium LLY-WYZ-15_(1-7)]HJL08119.1 sigma 54-interacting transcriptional regulator [Polyangiaceae bacterium LLY-WYZ-15_(1-7)]
MITSSDGPPADSSSWRVLRRLLGRLRAVSHRDDWLEEALDTLVALVDADRGLVSIREAGGDYVVHARGAEGALRKEEWQEASQSLVRRVHREGRSIVWEAGEDGSASLASLGIVAAAAAPIGPVGGEGAPVGVLYVDLRRPRRLLGARDLELLEAVADMVAVLLDRHRALAHARTVLADTRAAAQAPSLRELLAPESMAGLRGEIASLGDATPVLVTGESGTGKTLLCRAIAEAGERRPIVRALLGSSDDLNTISSELFGHARGAFSGATRRRVGLVEQADGGVLVLDEVLSLPAHAQQLLLDLTQFGTYRPLGWTGREPRRTDVRLLSATNGDLDGAVAAGRFREDLLYRLAGARLHLPPLRARREDVVPLAQGMLARLDPERAWGFALPLRRRLTDPALRWPGNLRQLAMVVRRARDRALAEDADADTLDLRHVRDADLVGGAGGSTAPPRQAPARPATPSTPGDAYAALQAERAALEERERAVLRAALDAHDGVVARVARTLGVPRTTLVSRLERLGVERRGRGGRA